MGIQGVTRGYRGLPGVTGGCKGLQRVTGGDLGYRMLQRIIETFFVTRTFPYTFSFFFFA